MRAYDGFFRQMESFVEEHGLQLLGAWNLSRLEAFRASWDVNDRTRQKRQEKLKHIFRYAVAHGMISTNPASQLGKVRVKRSDAEPFEDAEVKRILAAGRRAIRQAPNADKRLMAQKAYALALLMRYSGLRISDASMLAVNSLNGDRLTVRTIKTDVDVAMRLPKIVVEALHAFKPTTATHFFWSGQSSVMKQTDLYRSRYLKPMFKAAKVSGSLKPHRFRDTFSARLLESGVSINDVARLLGDTVAVVIRHYSKYTARAQASLENVVLAANGFPVPV